MVLYFAFGFGGNVDILPSFTLPLPCGRPSLQEKSHVPSYTPGLEAAPGLIPPAPEAGRDGHAAQVLRKEAAFQ